MGHDGHETEIPFHLILRPRVQDLDGHGPGKMGWLDLLLKRGLVDLYIRMGGGEG